MNTRGRPRKSESEKLRELSVYADPALTDRVRDMAFALDLRISVISRQLISRGLAAYDRDGHLSEPLPEQTR